MAFAALTTPTGAPEHEFYENIVEIPHYTNKRMQRLDREDEELLVQQNFEEFQRMYKPIIEENFKDLIHIDDDGKFHMDEAKSGRKYLMSCLNDNVLQNVSLKPSE